jgi:hypothetical protein
MTDQSAGHSIIVEAADEHVHEHGSDTDPLWSESHYLDAVSPDAATGVYLRLGRLPNQGRSHVMIAIVRPRAGPVILAVPDAPLPEVRGADLTVAAPTGTRRRPRPSRASAWAASPATARSPRSRTSRHRPT